MAGFSKGSDVFFRLSPAEGGKAQCFAVRRGESKARLDVNYNHPRYELLLTRLKHSPYAVSRIDEFLLSVAGGATPLKGDASLYASSGVRFFRIMNVYDGEIVEYDQKFITETVHADELGRSQLAVDDVLLTITGRVGSAAVVCSHHLPANINQHIARLRIDSNRCRPRFLSEWLNCPTGLDLSNRPVSGGTRGALDYSAIRNIQVALPESLAIQDNLVAAMNAARAKRKAKLAEAEALLAGLDGYVLDALGLITPPKGERKVFAVSKSLLGGQSRLNADYFHLERILALRALKHAAQELACPRLAQIVNFIRDQIKTPGSNYLSLANVQSNTGELVPTVENVTGSCSVFQAGDVLFARLRPYLNKVYAAENDGCCSPEFHVLRVKDGETLYPEYLAAILRSSLTLAQTRHMMTGNTHPRLTSEDVINLVIPVPKQAIQETIAMEARRRRDEARRLRAEAEAGWHSAKRWFEEQLLGSAPGQ